MTTTPTATTRTATPVAEQESMLDLLQASLSRDPDTVEELLLVRQTLGVTRFSRGRVHQNVEDTSCRLSVRLWQGGGHGVAVTGDATRDGVAAALAAARGLASHATAEAPALPDAADVGDAVLFADATAALDGSARVDLATSLMGSAGDVELAGNVRVAVQDVTMVNSAGLALHLPLTYVTVAVTASSGRGGTGYETAVGRDVSALDLDGLVGRALATAAAAGDPVVLDPGSYRVLLEPQAVSMLLLNLGYVGLNAFSAGTAAKGTSFVANHLGEAVASEAVTLVDDPLSPAALPLPIDAEGTAKERLTLIERGVAAAVAHDLGSAQKAGVRSTGHALPVGSKSPAPIHLAIEPGEASREELVAGIDRGLVINRIHPFISLRGGPDVQLSGTTRDGVFLVEGGEVVGAVRNLRWSAKMIELLRSVEAVSRERSVAFMDLPEFFPHTNHVPSLLCERLAIHGSQPHE